MEIKDIDIATVEALHDLLTDQCFFNINHPTLVKSRELTSRMYESINNEKKIYLRYLKKIEDKIEWEGHRGVDEVLKKTKDQPDNIKELMKEYNALSRTKKYE